ncbi:MAG: hypothetical protein ACP5IO_04110 [Elusimicrobiales bacterium]
MKTRYTVVLIIALAVFIFSVKKVYDKLNLYLYPKHHSSKAVSQQASHNISSVLEDTEPPNSSNSNSLSPQQSASEMESSTQSVSASSSAGSKKYKVTLRYENKRAKSVKLSGSFYVWKQKDMKKIASGVWEEELILNDKGIYKYYFVVDGKKVLDPKAKKTDDGSFSFFEVK